MNIHSHLPLKHSLILIKFLKCLTIPTFPTLIEKHQELPNKRAVCENYVERSPPRRNRRRIELDEQENNCGQLYTYLSDGRSRHLGIFSMLSPDSLGAPKCNHTTNRALSVRSINSDTVPIHFVDPYTPECPFQQAQDITTVIPLRYVQTQSTHIQLNMLINRPQKVMWLTRSST